MGFEFLKQTGYQEKFAELVQFVKNEAEEVNFFHGKAFYAKKRNLNLTRLRVRELMCSALALYCMLLFKNNITLIAVTKQEKNLYQILN